MRTLCIGLALGLLALALAATAIGGPATPAAIPGCPNASLNLVEEGRLSLATNNPASLPWWQHYNLSVNKWDASSFDLAQGYEGVVAYRIAKLLGFTKDQVTWQAVPFLKSFAPGKKSFDFYIGQVSNKPERRKTATFSASYYRVNQAVAGLTDTPIRWVRSLAALRKFRLGASRGASYDYIVKYIRPTQQPRMYNNVADVVTALKMKQIDGLVTDFPSIYSVRDQYWRMEVIGRLPIRGASEHFRLVFQKGNPLVLCVNRAISAMRSDGSLRWIEANWLGKKGAPILK